MSNQDKKNCLQIKIAIATTRSTRPYTFKDYIPDIILLLGIYNRKNTPLTPLKRGIRERFLFEGTFIFFKLSFQIVPFNLSYLEVVPSVKYPYCLLSLIVAIPKNHSKN